MSTGQQSIRDDEEFARRAEERAAALAKAAALSVASAEEEGGEVLEPAIVAATIAFENSILSSNYGAMTDAIEAYDAFRASAQPAMTTDPLARVAELEAQIAKMRKALEKCRPWIKDQILMGTDYQAVACQECVREIDAALTGTGDDVLADRGDLLAEVLDNYFDDGWLPDPLLVRICAALGIKPRVRESLTPAKLLECRDSFIVSKGLWPEFVASLDTPAAPTDGWIEWKGGECPVSGHQNVRVRLRSGKEVSGPANYFQWPHAGDDLDIIAYRLATPTEGRR